MDNWVSKVSSLPTLRLTTKNLLISRKDWVPAYYCCGDSEWGPHSFLDNGHPSTEENQTIRKIPLGILTVDQSGTVHVDKTVILEEREKTIPLDTSRSFKLNSGTVGVSSDVANDDSVFSKDGRIGLISDSAALSRAGLTKLSASANRHLVERERIISSIDITFWQHPQHIEQLNAFRRVAAALKIVTPPPKSEPMPPSINLLVLFLIHTELKYRVHFMLLGFFNTRLQNYLRLSGTKSLEGIAKTGTEHLNITAQLRLNHRRLEAA
ncbi:hypothetical protein C8J57DRAFT_1220971 [Mycena rebaudengoi]|nr:hypothetical protein C8J57DRAFT_1220971 [Mycena rebaudengoi]